MTLKSCIEQLMRGEHLNDMACQHACDEMLKPETNPLQIAAFLVLLRAKKETADELSAIVNVLRGKMIAVSTPHTVLDIVGTGGDGLNSVNISTGSALLAASCGIKVAKHGSRSVSSLTGSADVLEALGVNIQLPPEHISQCIDQIGIGFCYSPNFHPMTQALRPLRKALNVPTTFNFLGPLLNPTNVAHFILGVSDKTLLPVMADVLIQTGCERSVVVHGMGLDEISCVGPTKIIEIHNKEKLEYSIDALDFGLPRCNINDLQGGHAQLNAHILLDAFKGKRGPVADTLILNAAVALYIYGLHPSIKEAVSLTSHTLYSGATFTLLNNWIEFSYEQ
jgi:anthranilate phosphoribosyltransferase